MGIEKIVTRPDIDGIRRRAESATKGPWEINPNTRQILDSHGYELGWFYNRSEEPAGGDHIFIAHARTDIPALLDYVEWLEAKQA